jgi:putative transposase
MDNNLPADLEARINAFVGHYNHQRYHEVIGNQIPFDVYLSRGNTGLLERDRIKRQTSQSRRLMHTRKAAYPVQQTRQVLSSK